MGTKNVKSEQRRAQKLTRRAAKENGGLPPTPEEKKVAPGVTFQSTAKKPANSSAPAPTTTATPQAKKGEVMTVAGVREYNDFFGLFAKSVREKKAFRPLGFIPGPAVILEFREGGEVRILAATSDVARGFKEIPTPWMKWEALPEKIRKALAKWRELVEGLGYEPSPYNLGLARALLEGHAPAKYLAMTMLHFRYRPGDPELPVGVALLPVEVGGILEGLKVKTYNPKGIPDMPADGTILTLDELKNGRGPVQKLLRTEALMEGNFLSRYDREGNRRHQQNSGNTQHPSQPQSQFRRPTL